MRIRDYHSFVSSKQKQWTRNEVDLLLQNCRKLDCFALSNLLKRSQDSIRAKIKCLGLRPKKANRLQTRVNHEFFKRWSEPMAYVLGYWFADGYISKVDHHFSISSKDKEHLQVILDMMDSAHIIHHAGKGVYRFDIGSKVIWDSIRKLGGTPAKSFVAIPPNVPNKFIRHFIRGYFDGDGCVYLGKRGIGLNVRGTLEMMQFIKANFPVSVSLYQEKKHKKKNHWRLGKQGKKCIENLSFMYDDSTVFLYRKYEKYKVCCQSI